MTGTVTPSGDTPDWTLEGNCVVCGLPRVECRKRLREEETMPASEIGPKESAAPQGVPSLSAPSREAGVSAPSPAAAAPEDKPMRVLGDVVPEHDPVGFAGTVLTNDDPDISPVWKAVCRALIAATAKSAIEAIPEEFAQIAKFYDVKDMAALVRAQEERIEHMRQQLPKPRGPESDPQNYRRG